MTSSYQPIENYGIIGNMRTAALVGMNGSIDWLCLPHFDSPSVFAAILDDQKGGRFRIAPAGDDFRNKQFYWPDTNILDHAIPARGRRWRDRGLHAGRRTWEPRRIELDPQGASRPRQGVVSPGVPSRLRLCPRSPRSPSRRARRPLRRARA